MAEGDARISRELTESVRDVLGKVRIGLKKHVKLELRADKFEPRILVLTACRAFLLTARAPCKLETTFHYLDIQGVCSGRLSQLVIETERTSLALRFPLAEETDQVVGYLGCSLKRLFPNIPAMKLLRKVSLEPAERIAQLLAAWEIQATAEPVPCGGFSQMYACMCDYYGLPYREEVQWDVDTIYLSQDSHELNLQDFSHLDSRDLVPIIAALEYNHWFTKFSVKDMKLGSELSEHTLRVIAKSTKMEELLLENVGVKSDFSQKLASSLTQNSSSALHSLSLSGNPFEDRGVTCLCTPLSKLPKGLKSLSLARTSLTSKGVNTLAQALLTNEAMCRSLTHLDLSGNSFRGDDLVNLQNFLAQPNALSVLDLSATDCAIDTLFGPLLRGCCHNLSILNLSRNVFSQRRSRDVPSSFKQFFCSCLALQQLNLSGTKVPAEGLKALLLGLTINDQVRNVSLDLSGCELRSFGAQVLEGCIADLHNVSSLDISDNGLESDLGTLTVWLSKNRSLKHLALGKNFNNMKAKHLVPVLDNIVQMIQEEDSPLKSLSLADSKLKADLTIVINALGSNTSLTSVDLSGNGMGDLGAKMLAKALQINTKLRTVIWDKNNTTAQGFQDVARALEKNCTLRFMPTPINDASQALKSNHERTEEALQKIENHLLRNHEVRRFSPEQAYRLQQGIVTSTTQQMVDRLCVKVQDQLNSLRPSTQDDVQAEVLLAEKVMKDARNARTLLPSLYHVGGEAEVVMSAIQETLEDKAVHVAEVVDKQLKGLVESMLDAAVELCPHVASRPSLRPELLSASTAKVAVPQDFVRLALMEQAGADILNKTSEAKLAAATFLSDRLVDEILESLSATQHRLAKYMKELGTVGSVCKGDSGATEERAGDRRDAALHEQDNSSDEEGEGEKLEEMDTCTLTPKSKRKSIYSRKLRPVSKVFDFEVDLVAVTSPETTLTPTASSTLDDSIITPDSAAASRLPELPSDEQCKLDHVTKGRPRRAKRQPLGRIPTCTTVAEPAEGVQNGIMGRVDEGVDEFFTKRVTRLSRRQGLKRADSSEATTDASDKRRDSKLGNLFGFMKPRGGSSKTDRSQIVPLGVESSTESGIIRAEVMENTWTEEMRPAEPGATEGQIEGGRSVADERPKPAERKSSSPGARKVPGYPVMGGNLLAEMKAKQEKRAIIQRKAAEGEGESGIKEMAEPLSSRGRLTGPVSILPTSPKPALLPSPPGKPNPINKAPFSSRTKPSWTSEESGESVSSPTSPAGRGVTAVMQARGRSPSESRATPGISSRSATPEGELSADELRTDTDNELEQMSQRNNNVPQTAHRTTNVGFNGSGTRPEAGKTPLRRSLTEGHVEATTEEEGGAKTKRKLIQRRKLSHENAGALDKSSESTDEG
uniref:F-actin-uncapping protein LRRC16A-like isoform X2 n=1 Tax=Myxine glutinosa TaxID=7769 RepID=UPI00358FB8B3